MKFSHTYILIVICFFTLACNDPIDQKKQNESNSNLTTSIFWVDSIKNLGKVKMGDTIAFSFKFKNKGDNLLIINNIESSCSCTSIDMANKIIPKNDSGTINAVFDTRKSITGFVRKSIEITSNTVPHKKRLIYFMEITGHKKSTGYEKNAKGQ